MFDTKKWFVSGIAVGIAMLIAAFIVSALIQVIFPYNVLDLAGLRSITDPLLTLFFLYPFVFGLTMAAVYQTLQPIIKGNWVRKGQQFGVMTWLLAGLPNAFIVWTSMNYPIGFHAEQFIGSFIYLVVAALVIAKLNE